MSAQAGKDVIYIDIDDEITVIIDKVRGSGEKIVALVLPKRATVLQSIVNMKLLKRTADEAKKHLVLITSEAGLLPLAGSVGLYVAKSLQSRPEIPATHLTGDDAEDHEETVQMTQEEPVLDASRPVAEHARGMSPSIASPGVAEDESIELDNTTPAASSGSKKTKNKGGKKFSIPDFNKFRLWAIIGVVALVLLVFLWYMMYKVMPRAMITVKTDSTAVEVGIDVALDTNAKQVDVEEGVIPAVLQQTQKTATQQVEATGQVDKGTKATGQVTLSLKDCSQEQVTIPAGTGLSANGLTFITQQSATLNRVLIGNQCRNSNFPEFSTKTVNVSSQTAGEKYNLAETTYSVAGFSNVSGSGKAMTGGTSQIVKVVSQADIDSAKQKINGQDVSSIKQELTEALIAKNLYVIDATFTPSPAETTESAKVGDETATVTVTQKTTYTLLGTEQRHLKKLIDNEARSKIDTQKQAIIDYGLDDAVFKSQSQQNTKTLLLLDATVIAGSDLNVVEIKKQVAGKKANDAKGIIGKNPGVTEVGVRYSPFWVSSIPGNTSKITITIEKPVVKKDANKQ